MSAPLIPKVILKNSLGQLSQVGQRLKLKVSNLPGHFTTRAIKPFARGTYEHDQITRVIKHQESDLPQGSHVIGMAHFYDPDGVLAKKVQVALPGVGFFDLAAKCNHTIEMVPDPKTNELVRIERRMDTTGMRDDASKVLYKLTDKAARQFEETVTDPDWIKDVRVVKTGATFDVEINYKTASGRDGCLTLSGQELRSNFDAPLLQSPYLRLDRLEDIYQSDRYTAETEAFRPRIDKIGDQQVLILQKVRQERSPLPDKLAKILGEQTAFNLKVFPSTVAAVAVIDTPNGEVQVPINSAAPPPLYNLTRRGWESAFEPKLSEIRLGQTKTAVGPQFRVGNKGDFSLSYPRDPYFYGLWVGVSFEQEEKFGNDLSINRAKSMIFVNGEMISRASGIESGRTHVIPYELIFNPYFTCLTETNNRFYIKLGTGNPAYSGPGVSEDAMMDFGLRSDGITMQVYSRNPDGPTPPDIMTAEKALVNYDAQNTRRYCLSADLVIQLFRRIVSELVCGDLLGIRPVLHNAAQKAAVISGRLWYKRPFAALLENVLIPIYLVSAGHIIGYPVDLKLFLTLWLISTVMNNINYSRHLRQIGYTKWAGFFTGLIDNPSLEQAQHWGYLRAAVKQNTERVQWGVFVMTGKGVSGIPIAYAIDVAGLLTGSLSGFIATAVYCWAGLYEPQLLLLSALPALSNVVNLVFNALNTYVNYRAFRNITKAYEVDALANKHNPRTWFWQKAVEWANDSRWVKAAFGQRLLKILAKTEPDNAGAFYLSLADYREREPREFAQLSEINDRTQQKGPTYDDRFADIEALNAILKKYRARLNDGSVAYGFDNEMRTVLDYIVEVRGEVENGITLKAKAELAANPLSVAARAAVQKLQRQTREPFVSDINKALYRQIANGRPLFTR